MSQAFKKFQTLKRQVHGWKAKDAHRDKELQIQKYPLCRGTFTDCPTEPDFKAAMEKDPKNPPDRCKDCWVFKTSKFSEKKPYIPSEGVLKLLKEAKD